MTSSHPQKPFLLVRLLRTFSSFLDWLWAQIISSLAILSHAWSHLKLNQGEHMVNRPNESTEKKNARVVKTNALHVSSTQTAAEPAKAQETKQKVNYRKYVMWPVVAFRWLVQWLDDNSGAVTAIATVVIAVLTYFYATYSKKQWEVTRDQLQAYKDSQRAQLIFGDFMPTITDICCNTNAVTINGGLDVKNVGPTVAREIYESDEYGLGRMAPWMTKPLKLKPIPVPNGPSLDHGQSTTYHAHFGLGSWKEVQQGKMFYSLIVAVSYRDIFGDPQIAPACFMYYYRAKKFDTCPAVMDEGGLAPMEEVPKQK